MIFFSVKIFYEKNFFSEKLGKFPTIFIVEFVDWTITILKFNIVENMCFPVVQ